MCRESGGGWEGVGRLAAVPTVRCLCVCVWFQTSADRLDCVSMKLERTILGLCSARTRAALGEAADATSDSRRPFRRWRVQSTIGAEKHGAMQERQTPIVTLPWEGGSSKQGPSNFGVQLQPQIRRPREGRAISRGRRSARSDLRSAHKQAR